MMIRIQLFSILLGILLSASSCTDPFFRQEEKEVPTIIPSSTLIYMVADNNLYNDAINNINQMERGLYHTIHLLDDSTAKQCSILVYMDGILRGKFDAPCLLRIMPDTTDKVVSEIVKRYPEMNSANAESLHQVIADAETFNPVGEPIKNLVLWSHGTGWLPSETSLTRPSDGVSFRLQSFGYDGDGGTEGTTSLTREMNIPDLAKALASYHFNFIMFDACLMGSVEVCYELKDAADYIISAPTEALTDGFPYAEIVPHFFSNNDLLSTCKEIANVYYNHYQGQLGKKQSCSISVINTSKLTDLASFYQENLNPLISNLSIQDSTKLYYKKKLQKMDTEESEYFFDMKQYVEAYCMQNNLSQTQAQFDAIWKGVVMYEAHTPYLLDLKLNCCGGLSMYIPQGYKSRESVDEYYRGLKWSMDTN